MLKIVNELSLEELKKVEFDILKHFVAFCNKHNIKYYLSNGTLLGAVKYKGFIPWDDDIDVFVPREDYDRLLKIYEDSAQYKLFSFEKDGRFHYPFAKLCDMSTKKVLPEFRSCDAIPGVEIDIFPLDCWNSNYIKAQKEARSISRDLLCLQASQYIKSPVKNKMKLLVWKCVAVYAILRTGNHFKKKIISKSKANQQDNPAYVGCKSWCIYGEREIIPAEVFADTVEVEFEGETFKAPIGYDTYLRSLYGDYWQDPPLEKQKTHHSFTAYKNT